jgi:hypothetical protein
MRDAPLHLAEYKVLRAKTARESDRRAWIRAYSAGGRGGGGWVPLAGGGASTECRVLSAEPRAEEPSSQGLAKSQEPRAKSRVLRVPPCTYCIIIARSQEPGARRARS